MVMLMGMMVRMMMVMMMVLAVHFVRIVIVRTADGMAAAYRTAARVAPLPCRPVRCDGCRGRENNLRSGRFTAAAAVVAAACVTIPPCRTATGCCRCGRGTAGLRRRRRGCVVCVRMRFIFFSFSVSIRYVAAVSFSRGLLVVEVSVSSELSDTLRPLADNGCCWSSSLPSRSSPSPSTWPPPITPSSVASVSFTSVRQLLFVLEFTVPPLSIDFCECAVNAFFSCCCLPGVTTVPGTLSSWLLLLLLDAIVNERWGFERPCIRGRSGDSSAYGMFSPSVRGRGERPIWLHC
uniref:Secreted protein n=1 Tax=Anopheles culicifacies TaxID=139723 RepID=A0A182MJ12_9DIPT